MRKAWGFSYVELVFSIAILALLATVATPYLQKTIQRKKEAELQTNLIEIRTGIDAYKRAYDEGRIEKKIGDSGYPKSLQQLEDGVVDVSDPQKKHIKFLRRVPADPFYPKQDSNEPILATETWGKRSYDSDADNPREGDDVFDVYSLSTQVGLNGIPYREW